MSYIEVHFLGMVKPWGDFSYYYGAVYNSIYVLPLSFVPLYIITRTPSFGWALEPI